MFDKVCSDKISQNELAIDIEAALCGTAIITFTDVVEAVQKAKGLTDGVRGNMISAVKKIAYDLSSSGAQGVVDITKLQTAFERLTPVMLGFKTDNALAAFKSNILRALQLSGIEIMPGRHVTPLTPAWADLRDKFKGDLAWNKLSRFAHVASNQGWHPDNISRNHLDRFRVIHKATNIGSKTDKVVRNTINAWSYGQRSIVGWPSGNLGFPPGETRFYSLAWSAFSVSFQQDVEAYITRKEPNFLEELDETASHENNSFLDEIDCEGRVRRPLREITKDNYRDAFRRIASILVKSGHEASDIRAIADLIGVNDVKKVLLFMSSRTKKREGGHIGYFAFLLFVAARDHVHAPEKDVERLETIWRKVRGKYGEMSSRSFARLRQFDDEDAKNKMSALSRILAAAAKCRNVVDPIGIKLMRTAVFVAIGLESGNRSGNIINLKLDQHLSLGKCGKKWRAAIANPGTEVKNGVDLFSELTPDTAALIYEWINVYRPILIKECGGQSPYLFPNQAGGHLAGTLATQSLKDLAAYHAGLDMTPHAMRAFLGKLILDENPDAHTTVQQILGHRRLETTIKFYAPLIPMNAKRRLHRILLEKNKDYHDTL